MTSLILAIPADDVVAVQLALIDKAEGYRREATRCRKGTPEKKYCLERSEALMRLQRRITIEEIERRKELDWRRRLTKYKADPSVWHGDWGPTAR